MYKFIDNRGKIREITIARDILADQRQLAANNRTLLDSLGIKMIDIMGSVGTGKTSLVQQLIEHLKDKYRIVVLNGDLSTTIDQERVMQYGVEAVQVNTGKECHLDAAVVKGVFDKLELQDVDLIIVENVGNLICPVDFPLGSHRRLLVISVTEGPYVAVKHPYIFAEIDCVAINKIDVAPVMEIDVAQITRDIKSINANTRIYPLSCKEGTGIKELVTELTGGWGHA